jgi:thiamine-phosphate pyrophosphorylase
VLTKLKKRQLANSRLYLILDKDYCHQGNVVGIIKQISKKAVDLVQLRQEATRDRDFLIDAKIIKQVCLKKGIVFLINNRLDIAKIIDADGVHLGQSDLPLSAVRDILGENKIIGITCRNLTQALKAESQGADYISIGPIFRTQIKPKLNPINFKLVNTIHQRIKIPIFVIGGINHSNIKKVKFSGAKRFAICRAICCAKNAKKASYDLRNLI